MTEVLEQLAAALLAETEKVGWKHTGTGSPISVGYTHGPGGLLTFPGVDPEVFSNMLGNMSLIGQLPTSGSLFTDPTYWTVTGVQDTSGDNKSGVCDDAPVAGLMKACLTHSVFGRYEMATPELELNRLGQRTDRADPLDLRMINSPIAGTGLFTAGQFDPNNPADVLSNEIARKFWERNVAFHRLLTLQIWAGNPTNNAAGGGYKELTGLQLLVNTGYADIETGTACASVDSIVRDFNHARIDADGGAEMVAQLTSIYYHLKDRANRSGVNPVRWVIAMRPQLFYEITAIWPCSYLAYRCTLSGNAREVIDARDAVKFRDDMRQGKYLLIDGERIEVVVDDGIPELTATENENVTEGCFSTDIYFLPMSVVGGRSTLYMEYFNYDNPSLNSALGASNMVLARVDGAFLTWPRQTNQCVQWQSKIEPRLVLRTPWLAARLQNAMYCPVEHTRDTYPADPYHSDGGRTSRDGPSYNDLWE